MAKVPELAGIGAATPLDAGARAILQALFAEVLAPVPDVLRGDDTRAVHDMRVALRRLRTAMATFDDLFPKKRWRSLRVRMGQLGRRLGDVRDADVHLAALRGRLAGAAGAERPGVRAALERLSERRREALAAFAVELSQFDRAEFATVLAP